MQCYWHHNNDVITDVKLSGIHFICFLGEKGTVQQKLLVFQKKLLVFIDNLYYCEQMPLEYMQTRVYCILYKGTRTHTRVSVNPAYTLQVTSLGRSSQTISGSLLNSHTRT